ncbi:MAG: cytidine deaminase [Bacteroidales bacterium]|nr:cytidine deaminase [Bacteroidales bacterium]
MKKKQLTIDYFELSGGEKLEEADLRLISKAKSAAKKAYAPYSGFHVGAAVLLENGEIFTGSNQENAAFPSGICAERTALFAAASVFPDVPVKTIVITARSHEKFVTNPVSPCGSCRQVLLQTQRRYANDIRIIMYAEEKTFVLDNAADLLPLPFDKF